MEFFFLLILQHARSIDCETRVRLCRIRIDWACDMFAHKSSVIPQERMPMIVVVPILDADRRKAELHWDFDSEATPTALKVARHGNTISWPTDMSSEFEKGFFATRIEIFLSSLLQTEGNIGHVHINAVQRSTSVCFRYRRILYEMVFLFLKISDIHTDSRRRVASKRKDRVHKLDSPKGPDSSSFASVSIRAGPQSLVI